MRMNESPKIITTLLTTLTFCMTTFGAVGPARAQTSSANRLARIKKMSCVFPVYTKGSWKDGKPEAQIRNGEIMLQFDAIDAQDGSAQSSGPSGAEHLVVQLSAWSMHLMMMSSTGTLDVTTVFDQETHDKKLKAVHSTHDYLQLSLPGIAPSEPSVTQHYGECEAS